MAVEGSLLEAPLLDKQAVAQAFSRAALQYDQVASLQRDVFTVLIKPALANQQAKQVVDLGCGTGALTQALAATFASAHVVGVDFAPGMLRFAQGHHDHPRINWVCGDAERLPLATASIDLVVSNFALQWCEDFIGVFAEIKRVLAPGGRLLFTLPGDGTLNELTASWAQADPSHQHVNRFPTLDLLQGCAEQVGLGIRRLFTQRFQTEYSKVQELLVELKTLGAHNVNQGRARQLTGKQRLRDLVCAYETFRLPNDRLPATWQVIVGEWVS